MLYNQYGIRNLDEFSQLFCSDADCYNYLFALRSKMPFRCRFGNCCGTEWRKIERAEPKPGMAYRVCKKCGRTHESATSGTIFHASRLGLKKWFEIFWWAVATDGISVAKFSNPIGKKLRLKFKAMTTSYRVLDTLHLIMGTRQPLNDRVSAGLAMVGPQKAKKRLVGLVDSSSSQEIRLRVLADDGAESIAAFFKESVLLGTKVLTSGWHGFGGLRQLGYEHQIISPSSDFIDSALVRSEAIARKVMRLQEWLDRIGKLTIDKRNFPGYLAEFSFRYACCRKGYGKGIRFAKLLKQALLVPATSHTPSNGVSLTAMDSAVPGDPKPSEDGADIENPGTNS